MGVKVTLRQKTINKGRKSLYLDFYPPIESLKTGKPTRREFLGMYIYIDKREIKKQIDKKPTESLKTLYKELKPLNEIQKRHNSETLKLAEAIRQKKDNLLNKPEIYSEYEKEQLRIKDLGEQSFITYFKKMVDKKFNSNLSNWVSAYRFFCIYTNGELKFKDLNETLIEDFKDYLLNAKSLKNNTPLSQNSAVSYFGKLKATLKRAYKDGYLQTDLNSKVSSIKPIDTKREYLTIEELNSLVRAECKEPLLKRVALFSALTGLRFSDIQKMKWSELEFSKNQGYCIKFKQQKTKGIEVLPISEQAYGFTEGTENPSEMPQGELVFKGLIYSAYQNRFLKQWVEDAGITKKITFHCFRHTFATLQLYNGTDIYTVSKMLGHKELKTTQIYAKIVDEAKREAVNRIKLDI